MPRLKIDPYTQVYQALRTYLLNDPAVKEVFRPANVPDLAGANATPFKDATMDADFPALEIRPAGGIVVLGKTNTDNGIRQRFSIDVPSGDVLLHRKYFPAKFAIVCAFTAMVRTNGGRMGLSFVQSCRLTDIQDNFTLEFSNGTKGWTSLMAVEVDMALTNEQMGVTP